MQQHRHAALGDLDAPFAQRVVDLRHAALLTVAEAPNQRDDIEAELRLRQDPGPELFGPIGVVVQRTGLVRAAPHAQRQPPHAVQSYDPPPFGVGDPQPLPADGTALALGRQHPLALLRHRRRTTPTPSHPYTLPASPLNPTLQRT